MSTIKLVQSLNALTLIVWLLFSMAAMRANGQGTLIQRPGPVAASHVLVVVNSKSPDSLAIGAYYVQKRHISRANLCTITCPTSEECTRPEFDTQIEYPIARFLARTIGGNTTTNQAFSESIDFIVLTKGIPIRIHEGGHSTDSILASMGLPARGERLPNPYFNKSERFTFAKFHYRLVNRLDGYTRADCLKLVDNSLAAKPLKGPFLIHTGPGHEEGGYKMVNDGMRDADRALKAKGLQSILDTGDTFPGKQKNLMGYFSWGSNDAHYDKAAYNSLGFAPGGIAETGVSTSGRTFSNPAAPGQSLIADLIAQGVTGCKGYVSEPYADAIAHAGLLFDRYTNGFCLSESFYAATRYLVWKDVIIGDPLCAPYAAPKPAL